MIDAAGILPEWMLRGAVSMTVTRRIGDAVFLCQ
jgi:hypothetical protein